VSKLKFLFLLLFLGCEKEIVYIEVPPEKNTNELGSIELRSPIQKADGGYWIRLILTNDTIYVDYEELYSKSQDSHWKAILSSDETVLFDNGNNCAYADEETKSKCISFERSI
jgi:hypothetical protein